MVFVGQSSTSHLMSLALTDTKRNANPEGHVTGLPNQRQCRAAGAKIVVPDIMSCGPLWSF
jgi:hypothetical protein